MSIMEASVAVAQREQASNPCQIRHFIDPWIATHCDQG
jgi:hypothetical protein